MVLKTLNEIDDEEVFRESEEHEGIEFNLEFHEGYGDQEMVLNDEADKVL